MAIADALLDRVQQHERDTRTRLHQVEREVSVERGITRDLIEALHQRQDRYEQQIDRLDAKVDSLAALIRALTANGNGAHG